MIKRHYKEGEQLDVAGLNKITVLLDRSESEFTEIGHNVWTSDLLGPPHRHPDKDQIFYVTEGRGQVWFEDTAHVALPGSLFYVPANALHQTTTDEHSTLSYLLLNIFTQRQGNGSASFAEHIEKVKLTRKQQAESQDSGIDDAEKPNFSPRYFPNLDFGKTYEFGSNRARLLLDRIETNKCELLEIGWPPHSRGAVVSHPEKEQSFFILEGRGEIMIGDARTAVKPGDLIYIPRNTPHTTITGDEPLTYLCLNSLVDDPTDASFVGHYERISEARSARWKAGSAEVGE